jgi:hypothetical protein
MNTATWSPDIWLNFDRIGTIDASTIAQLQTVLKDDAVQDLVIFAHSWKNDKDDAAQLYGDWWQHTCSYLPPDRVQGLAAAGVLWPSKAYRTDFDETALAGGSGAKVALSADAAASSSTDLPEQEFADLLHEFAAFIGSGGAPLVAAARTAAQRLSTMSSHTLVMQAAAALGLDGNCSDAELRRDAAAVEGAAADPAQAQLLLNKLGLPLKFTVTKSVGRALGVGSVARSSVTGARAAVGRFLNQLTYYEMKKRAGMVGKSLAVAVLAKLNPPRPVRLHLVGHGFGGRLVSATVNEFKTANNIDLFSLTLLQAAYSHHGLAKASKPDLAGAFPALVGKPTGPIAITHTHNDLACTIAYALASRIELDIADPLGDANEEFGAMGANGPQNLEPSAAEHDDKRSAFKPKSGKVNTFLADAFIVKTPTLDAHNNVATPEVGRLLAATICPGAAAD